MKLPEFTGDHYQYFKNILSIGSERAVADVAVNAMKSDKESFHVVLEMCFTEKYPLSMRAARVIQLYCERNNSFLLERLDEILERSLNSRVEGVKRNFLKILNEFVDFQYLKASGFLLNRCFELLMDASEKPSIRNYCLMLLYKYAVEEKDIARELHEILLFMEEEPAISFTDCKNKILKKLQPVGQKVS